MKIKYVLSAVIALTLIFCIGLTCSAEEASAVDLLSKPDGRIVSVARYGSYSGSPACTLDEISYYAGIGADMVSVPVYSTSDGVPVLMKSDSLRSCCTDGNGGVLSSCVSGVTFDELLTYRLRNADLTQSEYAPVSLSQAVALAKESGVSLVVDNAWDLRDTVYEIAQKLDAVELVFLRTDASDKDIASWSASKDVQPQVIHVYNGNIIFSAVSRANRLLDSGMSCVQYGTGNYFGVVYDSITLKRFRADGRGRAMAATYDKNLCGQREDAVSGWDDLISRGYSVIETARPEQLVSYIDTLEKDRAELKGLIETLEGIDLSKCSSATSSAFSKALKTAKSAAESASSSVRELEAALVSLVNTGNALSLDRSEDAAKTDKFTVTPGKVIATLLGAAGVVAAQIYVHKRQKPKKKAVSK